MPAGVDAGQRQHVVGIRQLRGQADAFLALLLGLFQQVAPGQAAAEEGVGLAVVRRLGQFLAQLALGQVVAALPEEQTRSLVVHAHATTAASVLTRSPSAGVFGEHLFQQLTDWRR